MKYDKILEVMERQERFERLDEVDWKGMASSVMDMAGKALGGLVAGIANFFKAFGEAFKEKSAKDGAEFSKEAEARKAKGESNEVVEHNEAVKKFVSSMNNKDIINRLKADSIKKDVETYKNTVAALKSYTSTKGTPPGTPKPVTHGTAGGEIVLKQFMDFMRTTPPPDANAIKTRFITLNVATQKAVIAEFERMIAAPKYSDVDITLGNNNPQPGQKITLITYNVVCKDDEMDMPTAALKSMFESFNSTAAYTATGAKIAPEDIKVLEKPLTVRQGQVRVTGQTPSENVTGEGTALGTEEQMLALQNMYGKSVTKMTVGATVFGPADIPLRILKDRKDVAYIDFKKPYDAFMAVPATTPPTPPKKEEDFNKEAVKYLGMLNNEFKRMTPKGGLPTLSLWNTGGTMKPAYQVDPNKVYTIKVDWK
ncbi:MAG: hypothetical protein WCP55_01290 [Lentisphaerota bacterium]